MQRWEWIGIVCIVAFGASLHFLFAWSGYNRPVAIIAAVNESTWEHFKIAFWPAFLWALIEVPFLRKQTKNFALAKAMGFLTMPLVTAALFYSYTAITGEHYLFADIVIFIIAVMTGQNVSMRVMSGPDVGGRGLRGLSVGVILLLVVAFSTLSYYPLKNFIFEHPDGGGYGILEEVHHEDH